MAMTFKIQNQGGREVVLIPAHESLDLAIHLFGRSEGVALDKDEARAIAEAMLAWVGNR